MSRRRLVVRTAAGFLTVLLLTTTVAAVLPDVRRIVIYRLFSDAIGAPDITSPVPPIDTSRPAPLRLAVAGDVGTGDEAELRTAAAMDLLEVEAEYDALLLLGDNVYPNGEPAELDRVVFEPFAAVLDGGTQLLPVLGNHDVRDGNGDAHAAAIGMPARWYATRLDGVLIVALDSTRPDDPDQLAWLEATLAANNAIWTIATMHHPPYSGGQHGSSLDVRHAFSPLFRRYGVQLVLAGHDHDYQRSQPIDGVTYIVSGGASKLRDANRADFTEVAWSIYHFVDLIIWTDQLDVRAISHNGELFDAATIRP